MEILTLAPNILLYRFQEHYEVNVLALVDGDRCLLIDTGLTPQGKLLAADLNQRGLTVDVIINSHYHADHINGNRHFPDAKTWGSHRHADSDTRHQPPTRTLANGDTADYGPFQLRFLEARGHCSHQLITVINGSYAFIGDALMTSYDGEIWLPYITPDGSVELYLQDLDLLSELDVPMLIPSHGQPWDKAKGVELAKHYRYYLEKLHQIGPDSPPEEYLLDTNIIYTWHQRNLENIFGK